MFEVIAIEYDSVHIYFTKPIVFSFYNIRISTKIFYLLIYIYIKCNAVYHEIIFLTCDVIIVLH